MEQHSSPYLSLFKGFSDLAQTRGRIDYGPRDDFFEPGSDGTLQPNAHFTKAFMAEYAYPEASLPLTLRGTTYDRIKVAYYTAAILDDRIDPESLFVEIRETSGIKQVFTLRRELGEIITAKAVERDGDEEAEDEMSADSGLSDEERQHILREVFEGESYLLREESPAGDYARTAHLLMGTPPVEFSADDLDVLHALYDVVRHT